MSIHTPNENDAVRNVSAHLSETDISTAIVEANSQQTRTLTNEDVANPATSAAASSSSTSALTSNDSANDFVSPKKYKLKPSINESMDDESEVCIFHLRRVWFCQTNVKIAVVSFYDIKHVLNIL